VLRTQLRGTTEPLRGGETPRNGSCVGCGWHRNSDARRADFLASVTVLHA
jgi:hypothetical protein